MRTISTALLACFATQAIAHIDFPDYAPLTRTKRTYDSDFPLKFYDQNWFTTPKEVADPYSLFSTTKAHKKRSAKEKKTGKRAKRARSPKTQKTTVATTTVATTTPPPTKESSDDSSSSYDLSLDPNKSLPMLDEDSSDFTLNEGCGCASGCGCAT